MFGFGKKRGAEIVKSLAESLDLAEKKKDSKNKDKQRTYT
jgi:hypothetical protein